MQKLITIYLDDADNKTHGVREHLSNYLSDGWTVVSVSAAGSAVGSGGESSHPQEGKLKAWLAVVITKADT
jgi:hypothetical protein